MQFLPSVDIKHSKYSEVCDYFSLNPKPFTFGFVRNPFCRTVSWFTYLVGGHNDKATREEHKKVYGTKYLSGDFLDFCKYAPPFVFQNQYSFFTDKQGRYMADFVCRHETFTEDFNNVADILGIYPMITDFKKNISGEARHYSEYYGDEALAIVKEAFSLDLTIFNYTFDKK